MELKPTDSRIIGPVELQEYLFAAGQAAKVYPGFDSTSEKPASLTTDIRSILRLHRFTVINWLMMQGVQMPLELIADSTHPEVGQQLPDTKMN